MSDINQPTQTSPASIQEPNTFTDQAQVKKFVVANYFTLVGRILKEINYAIILALRAIGRLFLEAIGKR